MPANVAMTIAEHLADAGVRRLYGLPGGEMLDLLEAARQQGIDFIPMHHEAAAAFMAAAEGRYRRSPAACISTLGPGATNLVTGIAHAYLDRSPVIALTAQLPTTSGPEYTHQRVALQRLFEPITKGSFRVEAASAASVVEQAIELATSEPFGPVSLHVPRDVMLAPAGAERIQPLSSTPAPQGDLSLEAVADLLNGAARPLVLIGLGTPPDAVDVVRQFAETYGAPVGVTPKVKGLFDARHPLFSATYGGMMAESVLSDVVAERDLIFGIGLDPTELDRDYPHKERFVWLLPSPNIDQTTLPEKTWRGGVQDGLERLTTLVRPRALDGHAEAERIRAAVREKLESGLPANPVGMSPLRTLDTLAEMWPASEVVCCDVGAHKLLIGQRWPSSVPNRFFMSNGLSSMGYGVAAPIALSLATDGGRALSVVGDGGLMMYLGELETAARTRARVLFVVFCDASFALIESAQRRRDYPLYGMRFDVPDFARIGEAFGMPAWSVTRADELRAAVTAFEDADGPALIAVAVDAREYDHQAS